MFYGDKVEDTRALFRNSWRKFTRKESLSALEQQLVSLINEHPEYHSLLEKQSLEQEPIYGDDNPFLHMGLHLAIREQLVLNQPPGIVAIYQRLLLKYMTTSEVEHRMMPILNKVLWDAQNSNNPPDAAAYLRACENLLN